jgi:AraC-like DNA-binding protein/mannose-6-phosphate isomerase-like protein (cupin superfamily)
MTFPQSLDLGPVRVEVYQWAEIAQPVVNPPHRHAYFEACWVRDGRGEFTVAGRTHPIGPGDLFVARPGVPHRIVSEEGIGLAWIAFRPRSTVDGLVQRFADSTRALLDDPNGRLAALWQAARLTASGPALPGTDDATRAVAQALLVVLAQAGTDGLRPLAKSTEDPRPGLVRQALRYIADNLDRPLPVDELARHVHLSRRQLTRLFATEVGVPPAGYVERARLDRATALLHDPGTPIKHVAAAVGYPDVTQFTRAFTRRLGTPPGRYRAQIAKSTAEPGNDRATQQKDTGPHD